MIAESQKQQGWGKSIVTNLSSDLKKSFPDVNFGFSERNLWNMRQFYLVYKDNQKLQQLAAEIGWTSKELKKRMVSRIKKVLLEFGRGFSFIGDEYRMVAPNGRESFIDLLCFNRVLRSVICIEVKTGRFKPEYAGKMNYYLSLIDSQIKEPGENPSIGIILCTSKDHVDVDLHYVILIIPLEYQNIGS